MRLVRMLAFASLIGVAFLIGGCGHYANDDITGDLQVGVIVSQPLMFYYGETGLMEVWGPAGTYLVKEVPMYLGNQVITFRNVPIGRYVVTVTYSGLIATKGAVLCSSGDMQWRSDCADGLKCILQAKKRGNTWDCQDNQPTGGYNWYWTQSNELSDFATPSPAVGHREPLQAVVIFNIPEDALKYDP